LQIIRISIFNHKAKKDEIITVSMFKHNNESLQLLFNMTESISTVNRYITEVFRWNAGTGRYEKKDDCLMTLDTSNGDFNVFSTTKQSDNDLTKRASQPLHYISVNVLKDNFSIISRKHHKIASMSNSTASCNETTISNLVFEYEFQYEGEKFGISFDQRSAAAEDNFYTEYTKLRTKYQSVEYYESKRIKMEGNKINNQYEGFCVEYYDLPDSPIKYVGEFENGKYDGSGDFFSSDGYIRLICGNICAGKPNRIGRLIIGKNRDEKYITMLDFKHLNPSDPNYTNDILKQLDPEYDDLMALLKFESMSLDERTLYLFKELQKLSKTITATSVPKQAKPFFNLF
jgi:hypothetical protein